MPTKDKPETLIQLLASYRRADFPKTAAGPRTLARLAATIANNSAATIAFAERQLKTIAEDSEGAFTLWTVCEEAAALRRRCASLARGARSRDPRKEVVSLRVQYDNFTDSVRHLVGLLDRDLVKRLDGIL